MTVAWWRAQKAPQELKYSNARAVCWSHLFADTAPKNYEIPSPSVNAPLGEGDMVVQRARAGRPDLQALLYADLGRALRGVGANKSAILLCGKAVAKAEKAYALESDKIKDSNLG